MLPWLLVACVPATTDSAAEPAPAADIDITLTAAPAFDPASDTPLTWAMTGADADPAAAGRILDESDVVIRKQVASGVGWDGRDDAGALAATGAYTLVVGTDEAERQHPFAMIRAGLQNAYAEDDGGTTATRVPLYWSARRHIQDVDGAFVSVDAIDNTAGAATPLPPVSDNLVVAEADFAQPLAYTFDSRPIIAVQLGDTTSYGAANLTGAELHASVDGWTVLDDAALVDGGVITLQRDEPLSATVGVSEESLGLRVIARDDAGASWTINELSVPLRIYRLLDAPTWEAEGERYFPWVDAIDPALRALEGTAAERNVVLDALVRWVYEDNGLAYDTVYGASVYTTYARNDWERANFDMGGYLSRKYGVVVNCTDCAGIIVGFGNMLGADVDYAIIGFNFDLNYILAIGGDEYTHCPFGPGGCGFSYHAVSVSPESDLIWDATLALDGDADPGSAPHDELLVQAIDADEYLERLAKTRTEYAYQAQGTLQ
ncbi:MAG: hypothetical protein EXR71_13560 [Myxococcales bacterium]|nr:hypothetical protein [Myxococcales bacterium]